MSPTPTNIKRTLATRWIARLEALNHLRATPWDAPTRSEIMSIKLPIVAANSRNARNAVRNPPVLKAKAATAARNGPTQPTPTSTYAAP